MSSTLLGSVGKGLLAGVAGTAAMTAWQEIAAKLRSSDVESGGPPAGDRDPWETAPAPAKVAKLIGEE